MATVELSLPNSITRRSRTLRGPTGARENAAAPRTGYGRCTGAGLSIRFFTFTFASFSSNGTAGRQYLFARTLTHVKRCLISRSVRGSVKFTILYQ